MHDSKRYCAGDRLSNALAVCFCKRWIPSTKPLRFFFIGFAAEPNYTQFMKSHREIDHRNMALALAVVRRIEAQPDLAGVEKARGLFFV